jgi:hypothetical protein
MSKYEQALVRSSLRSLLSVPIFDPKSRGDPTNRSVMGVLNIDSDDLSADEIRDVEDLAIKIYDLPCMVRARRTRRSKELDMTDQKRSRLSTEWNEIEPAVFERKGYSVEQTKQLDRRPDDLIRSALGAATKIRDEKNNRR